MRPLRAVLLTLLLALAVLPVAGAHAKVAVGIADNKSDM
ncbi:MAG: hypothetical protein QOF26_1522, partial [Baekduia sp.]|nr:hypothetical protein [Baekduia sp.]